MYEDLIARLRKMSKISAGLSVLLPKAEGNAMADLLEEAADALEKEGNLTADVRPVVRGEWLKSPECPEEYDICSVCGLNDKHRSRGNAEHPVLESIPPFCKWCGADMREVEP